MGGGRGGLGAGEVQKKYSRKGKLNEKNSCTPINPKKYSCYGLKKKSYKEFENEKKSLRLENSLHPITFLMVCPFIKRRFAQQFTQVMAQKCKKFHFRLTCVAQKRRCLNFLLYPPHTTLIRSTLY